MCTLGARESTPVRRLENWYLADGDIAGFEFYLSSCHYFLLPLGQRNSHHVHATFYRLFSRSTPLFFFFLPNIEKYKAASSKRNLTKTRIRRSKKNEAMRRCMQKESRSRRVHAIVDVQTGWSVTTDGNNNGNNNNEGKLLVWRDRSKVRIPRRPGFRRWAKVGRITAELLSAKRGNRIDSDYRRPIFDFPTTGSRNLARFIPCSANGCHRCWLNIVYR